MDNVKEIIDIMSKVEKYKVGSSRSANRFRKYWRAKMLQQSIDELVAIAGNHYSLTIAAAKRDS